MSVLRRLAGKLGRLLNPDAGQQTAALEKLRKRADEQTRELERQREELAKLRTATIDQRKEDLAALKREVLEQRDTLRDVQTRVGRALDHDLERLSERFSGLRASVDRQAKLASKAMSRAEGMPRWILDEQQTLARLARLAKSGRPIVVGPWTGEVGFELLYWAPFVRWALAHYDIDPARVTVVSRGGTESWYGLPAGYEDALRIFTPAEFKAGSEDVKKQRAFRPFDRALVRRLRSERGAGFRLLHPALMYQMFWPYWREELTYRHVLRYSHQRLVTPPDVPEVTASLPREFVAVRFYFSSCFPETVENRALVASVLASLAERSEVVLLGSGLRLDDHREYAEAAPRVRVVTGHDHPARNLAVQTAVIARAKRFVGTYGGFAYLAPYLGVDSLAFYSVKNFRTYHLEFAQRVFDSIGGGTLLPLDAAKTALAADALAGDGMADAARPGRLA